MHDLLIVMEDVQMTTTALIDAYYARLALDPPSGGRLRRWQSRTLSALRATGKARAKTQESIRKLRQSLAVGNTT
jgi:hypothetical protein